MDYLRGNQELSDTDKYLVYHFSKFVAEDILALMRHERETLGHKRARNLLREINVDSDDLSLLLNEKKDDLSREFLNFVSNYNYHEFFEFLSKESFGRLSKETKDLLFSFGGCQAFSFDTEEMTIACHSYKPDQFKKDISGHPIEKYVKVEYRPKIIFWEED